MSESERPATDVEELTSVLAERARESAGPDPEVGEILDYLEGRLSPEAAEAMERRLVASPSASRKLLDLADLTQAGADAEGATSEEPADLAIHAGWRDLQERLPADVAPSRRPARTATAGEPPSRVNRTLAALAATLFVAVLALGAWVWDLRRDPSGKDGLLVANLQTLELFEVVRSERAPAVAVEPGEPFRVALHPEERCASYRAEIVGPGGSRHVAPGLEPDELGRLDFLFLGGPGGYTLRLLGCEPEREISTYGFEIVPPGNATSGVNAPER